MKILYLSPWFPYPPNTGAKIRVFNVLRYLAENHQVTFISFSPEEADPGGLSFCTNVFTIPSNPFIKPHIFEKFHFFLPYPIVSLKDRKMVELVKSVLAEEDFSAAISFTSVMAPYLISSNIPKVLDIDTSITGFAIERLHLEQKRLGKLRAYISLQKNYAFERKMVEKFDATVVLTSSSYNSIKKVFLKKKPSAIIGNGVDLQYYPYMDEEPEPNTLIFNGAISFSANFDAMQWFLQEIFPKIEAEIPNVKLKITGKIDGTNYLALPASDKVEFTGFLDDIRPTIARSWVCIVPIRIGGGQRMKILEAMALGTPVVTTSRGIEGIDAQDEEHVLIADDPIAFAQRVVKLLKNNESRKQLSQKARFLMESTYRWETILSKFETVIKSVGETCKGR